MSFSTYSFEDVTATLNFSGVIPIEVTGAGVGSIDINMASEKTAHDIGADGTVMISKIKGNNGSVAISLQQTSPTHKLLLLWYNYLLSAPSNVWASNSITIRNNINGDTIIATGVSPQKLPDRSYQAQGQRVTWNFMAADISQIPA